MEIGLGIDGRFALAEDEQRAVAREAKALGYTSLWTPIGSEPGPFDVCAAWSESAAITSGIAVAPLPSWPVDRLASVAKRTVDRSGGRFVLGVGAGRLTASPIRAMRDASAELRARLPGVPLYLGALGPQMLRLAGERYDGAALNWCTREQVAWSRERVAAAARSAGRDPREVRIHEYIRVCVDEDESAARLALAKTVLAYALARPGADKTKGYRAHFARMGFAGALTDLESRRDSGASEDDLAAGLPDELLRRVGYWGGPEGAREPFVRLAEGLDIAVVRLVPGTRNDAVAVRLAMKACAPG
jgi:alkanesulfonate monooxygenase SsuD/methylene tetrahydromethanopterin reductase-like flavin-dependent oxidoreductase (luciferase family)